MRLSGGAAGLRHTERSHHQAGSTPPTRVGLKAAYRFFSLVINPGGPGESGMSVAASLVDQVTNNELGRRFDLVGFDPRGVGSSQPQVRCLTPPQSDAERLMDLDVDTSPAGVTLDGEPGAGRRRRVRQPDWYRHARSHRNPGGHSGPRCHAVSPRGRQADLPSGTPTAPASAPATPKTSPALSAR